jgi:hypothetical protein
MAQDARLDLGRYVQNPFNRQGQVSKKLDFHDLFASKPATGEYPWNPSRFSERDLMKRMMTRKETLNPALNFVGKFIAEHSLEGINRTTMSITPHYCNCIIAFL